MVGWSLVVLWVVLLAVGMARRVCVPVLALVSLALVTSCAPGSAPDPAEARSPSAVSVSDSESSAPISVERVPVTTIDVGRTQQRRPTLRPGLTERTRLPLLIPPRTYTGRRTLSWRDRAVAVPRNLSISFVTSDLIVGFRGSPPQELVSLPWSEGRPTRLWRAGRDGSSMPVVPGDANRLWWSHLPFRGDGRVLSWGPRQGARHHLVDLGPPPDPTARQVWSVGGVLGDGDVILTGRWDQEASSVIPPIHERTSGRPAEWGLEIVLAVSAPAGLVAGLASDRTGSCLAVFAADDPTARWIRCFERRGRPGEIVSAHFTSDGSRLVVLIRGGDFDGPAAIFHVGRDTLLVLDTAQGRIANRIDHNFDRVVLEDDRHVIFVRHRPPHRFGTDEGSYVAWLVRCRFDGLCEPATPPLPADTSTGAVSVVPRG